jgi:hypothetical protein
MIYIYIYTYRIVTCDLYFNFFSKITHLSSSYVCTQHTQYMQMRPQCLKKNSIINDPVTLLQENTIHRTSKEGKLDQQNREASNSDEIRRQNPLMIHDDDGDDSSSVTRTRIHGPNIHDVPPSATPSSSLYSKVSTLTPYSVETPQSSYALRNHQKKGLVEQRGGGGGNEEHQQYANHKHGTVAEQGPVIQRIALPSKPVKHCRDWGMKPETEVEKERRINREKAKEFAKAAREKAQRVWILHIQDI